MSNCDPADSLVPLPSDISITSGYAAREGPVEAIIDETLAGVGAEGYFLTCHKEGFRLEATTERGLFYGRQTLRQISSIGLIPCCKIVDNPAMSMRAVMFDLARCKEKHDYYYEMIELLSQWKINTVFLHLTDHSGCALRFNSYPNLATQFAFTQDEMRKLISYAAERHIELIPEIETWGHARYITRLPELADLAENKDDPRALCTSNPKTWEVLGNILDEVAALFPSKYIHAGCDEAAFGTCATCVAKADRDGKGALVGEHVRKVCELVKARGKVPMIWGDVLLAHRESADIIPKDAVVCHWDYKPDLSAEPVEFLKSKGYEVVGCPAIVWGSRMILPMADTLDNVENFARIVLDKGCLGMETTVWYPQRYICDTLYFGLAHACEMSWSNHKRSRLDFGRAFARDFFGLDPNAEIAQALIDVHQLSEKSLAKLMNLWAYAKQLSELGAEDLAEDIRPRRERARSIARTLKKFRESVTTHLTEYDTLILAAEISDHLQERSAGLHSVIDNVRKAEELSDERNAQAAQEYIQQSIELVERLVQTEDAILPRLEAAWDRWRYAEDPIKTGTKENLTGSFHRSGRCLRAILSRLQDAAGKSASGQKVDWGGMFEESGG